MTLRRPETRKHRVSLSDKLTYALHPSQRRVDEERAYQTYLDGAQAKFEAAYKANRCPKADIRDFSLRGKLGMGGFGVVVEARYRGRTYALKISEKTTDLSDFDSAITEKKFLYALDSDFIVKLSKIVSTYT